MQILFLMADGFEETEFVTPFDYFKRAGFEVCLASISDSLCVTGAHGLRISVDAVLEKIDLTEFDGCLLPGGGPGVKNLKACSMVTEALHFFSDSGKWILAICAAPLVLSKACVIENRQVTCFPGCESELVCKKFLEDRVVVDGNIVTSRSAGTAEEFALACIRELGGIELSEKIRAQILAR